MIDRSFYLLILVMNLFYVAAGRSRARKPKVIRIEALEAWMTMIGGSVPVWLIVSGFVHRFFGLSPITTVSAAGWPTDATITSRS
jgi:hypothetical protein